MAIKRNGVGPHYSEVIEHNGILYLSGQVNTDTDENGTQSRAVLA